MVSIRLKLLVAFSSSIVSLTEATDPIMEERKDLMCKPGKYGLQKMENRRL